MDRYIFWVVFFFAYTMQGITGFAGNIFIMPVGASTVGLSTTIATVNITGFLACALIALTGLKHVAWREFLRIIIIMTTFMFVGIWLDTILPLPILLKIFGVVVLLVGLQNLLIKRTVTLPEWLLNIVLMLAGLMQGMFVSGGAFLVIYVLQKIKNKEAFRVTLSLVWTVLNAIYALFALQAGEMTGDVASLVVVCIPLLIVATFLGSWIEKRMSQKVFLKMTYVMLILIGILLIFK
ncbi:MAG: sulfite exporter TauE/SafE family protein [Eggerthellaceae bacterium]|jgi:uncharacterized membrane protein YfcA|nr:sulfite exporter TauE/SafE family protein [Eggerthellaceae bacterium]MCH4220975.1 sulfite exporter TauE/SafE family protein [Eggerthellaceae bacterium]